MKIEQRLPFEFRTGRKLNDQGTYCYWFKDGKLCFTSVNTPKEAYEFVTRAKEKKIQAFASAYVSEDAQHEVIAFAPYGSFAKYAAADSINLSIARAYHLIITGSAKRAEIASRDHVMGQWGSKEYPQQFKNAERFEVSYYTTDKPTHIFKSSLFDRLDDAIAKFEEFKGKDIPCRMIEIQGTNIHEIKAANQHWYIGMGCYLEQLAKGDLPLGEIPYLFSNQYLASEMEVDGKYGYLPFHVHLNSYTIQISGTKSRVTINVDNDLTLEMVEHVIVIDNPVLGPWINKVQRGW